MKKIILSSAAVLCVAASIFGGYYYYVTNDLLETEVRQNQKREKEGNEATDKDVPMRRRGGAWFDENGNIKENGIADALSQRKLYLDTHMPPDGFGDKGDGSGIPEVPSTWVPRGPQNLGGRTEAIVLHPDFATNGIMWAGGSTGGVWKSVDGGMNWNSTNTMLDNYNVSCLALDPTEPKILYAGTGQSDGASLLGGGVFKSYDGGMNWQRMERTYENRWRAVNGIAVVHDPQHPNDDAHTIVLAAIENYDFYNEDVDRGIIRSTDGGRNWTKVKNAITASFVGFDPGDPSKAVGATCDPPDTDIHPDGYCKVWHSTDYGLTWSPSQLSGCDGQFVPFESRRWKLDSFKDSIHFAFHRSASPPGEPSPPTTIYAQYGDQVWRNPAPQNRTLMSKSDYTGGAGFGAKFSTCNLRGIPDGISQGVHAFWVSPQLNAQNPNSISVITGGAYLYRSNNNAQTFEDICIANGLPLENPVNPHVDMQTVVADPSVTTNKSVFVATDGGIYHTEDVTTATGQHNLVPSPGTTPSGWNVLNDGLQNTQYYSVAGERNASTGIITIVGGTQDNGTLRLLGGSTDTVNLVSGDGGASAIDGTFCFGQNLLSGQFFRFSACSSASPTTYPITDVDYPSDYALGSALIIDTDPRNNNASHSRAFLGARFVWRTDNVKTPANIPPGGPLPIWVMIKAPPVVDTSPEVTLTPTPEEPLAGEPRVTAMALAPSDSNYMWVAEDGFFSGIPGVRRGNLYRSTNALTGIPTGTPTPGPAPMPTWEKVDDGSLPLPNRQITKILIDQNSSDADSIVYVAFGGFEDDNLWRTINNGDSWRDISGGVNSTTACDPGHSMDGLPCAPVRAIARHPINPNILIVGTEIGIYVTKNVNAEPIIWEPVMKGPANVSIDDLNFIKGTNVLLAGTYGRGVWSLALGPTVSPRKASNDFDGDGRSDLAVVRDDGVHLDWHRQGSSVGYSSREFGAAGDSLAAADYDGDGKTDLGVFRPSESRWYSLLSSSNTLAVTELGDENAKSVPADFDGDSLSDKAVWKPFEGIWEVQQSQNGNLSFQWGAPGDTPVAIDIDGDAKADYGVWREANGVITLSVQLQNGGWTKQFGLEGDVAVPGEYDGDGKIDLAVWRPDDDGEGNGCWYIVHAADSYTEVTDIPWGENGDIPAPGDYDGDGKLDIAVWRPSTGMWHMLQSSNGYYSELFGADGDTPVGIKAVYNARPSGRPFTRVPPNAVPRRRTYQTDKPGMTTAD